MRIAAVLTLVAVTIAIAGCGQKKGVSFKTVPVTIKLTYKGQPLDGANVQMYPLDPNGRGATGKTDANGAAVMRTFGDAGAMAEGAIPGKYKIIVTKVDVPQVSENINYEEYSKQQAEQNPYASAPKPLLPTKYSSPQTTPFECEVKDGPNEFSFELTD
ncbi:MAG TPA: hypothetical protein PLO20_15935 [Thermogutta sp.]|nr:hypothetical protein [Thermogutta sp.]HQF14589.1 hypothetical protein [Thermogutta sp.]